MSMTVAPKQTNPAPVRHPERPRRSRRWLVLLMFAFILFVFALKIANYVAPEAIRFPNVAAWFTARYKAAETWYSDQPQFQSCPARQRMAVVPGGYVCTTGAAGGAVERIFATYPMSGGSKEAVYTAVTVGSRTAADNWLRGRVDVPRYQPVTIAAADLWQADPYHGEYWRFYYYSLRPTVSLLVAYRQTGDHKYASKLIGLINSFISNESRSPYAWVDYHAVAFRSMVLTYEWWELRRLHLLSLPESTVILDELIKTGNFLADRNHYQPEMNHGTNESAALLQLGVDFPALPGAAAWLATARTRLAQSLLLLFDADGALIENSPYYHFYELDKYWQIYQFSRATHVQISGQFTSRLRDMITYATYVLQPNGAVPLLGASLAETIQDHDTFAAIAHTSPAFQYVLSHGLSGTQPADTSHFFSATGLTIMRSGWGKGTAFTNAAYLTFNVGAYRTNHSALDALGFTLYDNGATLLPGPGLYTYTPGAMQAYFHGTASHDTVVVDGRSQEQGTASAGPLVERDGVTYQSGSSPLYDGVTHMRTLMMLDKNHFLVIDRLSSASTHTYQQMFHLFPGAKLHQSGLTVSGVGASAKQSVTLQQLNPAGISLKTTIGQTKPPMGLCSNRYQIAEPCYALAYTQRSRTAAYTTLISVGPRDPKFAISFNRQRQRLVVHDRGRVLAIALGAAPGRTESVHATDPKASTVIGTPLPGTTTLANWTGTGGAAASVVTARDDANRSVLRLTAEQDTQSATDDSVNANLSRSNLQVRIKLTDAQRVHALTLSLSNDNWSSSARIELRDSYPNHDSGGWVTISLGRGSSLMSGVNGHWELHGKFAWGSIDAARLTMDVAVGRGPEPSVELDSIKAIPEQRTGAAVLVFDDGYESILPAAQVLHEMGMPANVAVIGKVAALPWYNYLNIFELKMLQNDWGWNMVSHTQQHRDAVTTYYDTHNLGAYEQDLVDGALFLERAGLNTAPNWLIYPHGTTNAELMKVVARFYKFARTTQSAAEAYPYGSPLQVKNLELVSPGDAEEAAISRKDTETPPAEVIAAARDALRYHTTLMLTLHRITALASDRIGYPIADFRKIVTGLKKLGIPVLTLSQLDAMDSVPEDNRLIVRPAIPPLITVAISSQRAHDHGKRLPLWPLGLGLILLTTGLLLASRRRHGQLPDLTRLATLRWGPRRSVGRAARRLPSGHAQDKSK